MDSGGHISSVQRSSEQQNPVFQIAQGDRDNIRQKSPQDTTASTHTTTSSNRSIPAFANQVQGHPFAITTTKGLPEVNRPEFSIPPLPANLPTRRNLDTPDDRVSRNPAHQPISYPMSLPQDAPKDYKTLHERPETEEEPPAQRRRLTSPDRKTGPGRSEEEGDPQKASGANKTSSLSYDPVHENVDTPTQPQETGHSRRPSSANSHRSQLSSYSDQSSNQDPEGSSPLTGDPSSSRDGKKRKHKCQECGQYFTRLHNLKSHLLTHSQEKPFICDECGHKFRRLHDLKRHHKLHTGERPYTCPGCNRSFARMDALNRHRKPGGECSLHNMSTSSSSQMAVERRMSLPPGFGRPGSSQGSTSPMPQTNYTPSDLNINPALAAATHGHSYPPTHLPPKQKHHYHRDAGEASPGLLAPPSSTTPFGRSPPLPPFGPTGNGRGVQPPPLVIPSNSSMTGPTLSPIHSHHYSSAAGTSSSSGGRSAQTDMRSPIPPMVDQSAPPYSLTESPRGMTPPPLQPPPPLAVPASSLPLLPSPGTLMSPSPRNSYDRTSRQSIDTPRPSEASRGYFDALVDRNSRLEDRNSRLEDRVKHLESYVGVLWQERDRRPGGDDPSHRPPP